MVKSVVRVGIHPLIIQPPTLAFCFWTHPAGCFCSEAKEIYLSYKENGAFILPAKISGIFSKFAVGKGFASIPKACKRLWQKTDSLFSAPTLSAFLLIKAAKAVWQ